MSRYRVDRQQNTDGLIICRLVDRESEAEAQISPQLGNNLFRFTVNGLEILAYPAEISGLRSASDRYGTPILFPPNRVSHGRFAYGGRTYQLNLNAAPHHMHGEIRNQPWQVKEVGVDEQRGAFLTCTFRFAEHADLLERFIHPYAFTFTYGLKDGELRLQGEIKNEGPDSAPLFLGLHPYFSIGSDAVQDTELLLPAEEEWQIGGDGFVQGEPAETEWCRRLRKGVPVTDFPHEGYRLFSLSRKDTNVCELVDRKNCRKIIYETGDRFPFIAVFNPRWLSGLSIEPYTCVTDAYNLPMSGNRTGVQSIPPGAKFEFTNKIRLERNIPAHGEM